MSCKRDLKDLISEARAQGWTVTICGSGHLKFVSPAKQTVFTSSTPGDYRVVANMRAHLRRLGFRTREDQERRRA